MAWYTEWFGTRYYKLLYGHRDQAEALHWADAILRNTGLAPGSTLLDIGCGRGRHAAAFAARGLQVTGIDLSPESIAEARSTCPAARFDVHDMREPFARGTFDAVVCLFTSIGYTPDRADDLRTLASAAVALRPGGKLVVDVLNGAIVRRELVEEERQTEGGVRFTLQRRLEGDTIIKDIHVDDQGCSHRFTERVHAWTAAELRALVVEAGLRIDALTGGPGNSPFDEATSERIVVWATKP